MDYVTGENRQVYTWLSHIEWWDYMQYNRASYLS